MKRIILAVLVLLVLFVGLPWLLPRPGLDGMIPDAPFVDSRFGDFSGVRLHWRERNGDPENRKPLVVLLHGFGGSAFSWRYTLGALERAGFDVVAPDLPPFGYSQRTSRGPDWATLVDALAATTGDDRPVHWVGHSMGAAVASRAALRRPDRTESLTLVGGAPVMRQEPSLLSRLSVFPPFARAAESWAAWRYVGETDIRSMLESAFGRPPTDEELTGYRRPLIVRGTYPALLKRLAKETGGPSPIELPNSTRLIWGEFDRWVPQTRGETVVESRPDIGPIEIVEQAGHNPMDTHPAEFHRLLLDHFSGAGGPVEPSPTADGLSEPRGTSRSRP